MRGSASLAICVAHESAGGADRKTLDGTVHFDHRSQSARCQEQQACRLTHGRTDFPPAHRIHGDVQVHAGRDQVRVVRRELGRGQAVGG